MKLFNIDQFPIPILDSSTFTDICILTGVIFALSPWLQGRGRNNLPIKSFKFAITVLGLLEGVKYFG